MVGRREAGVCRSRVAAHHRRHVRDARQRVGHDEVERDRREAERRRDGDAVGHLARVDEVDGPRHGDDEEDGRHDLLDVVAPQAQHHHVHLEVAEGREVADRLAALHLAQRAHLPLGEAALAQQPRRHRLARVAPHAQRHLPYGVGVPTQLLLCVVAPPVVTSVASHTPLSNEALSSCASNGKARRSMKSAVSLARYLPNQEGGARDHVMR